MSTAVVTVASGGLPVVELAAGKLGLPVTEATNGFGIAVTKVVGLPGLPVVFDTIGGGAAWTPVQLTGLAGWWDASVAASLNLTGSSINSVTDQSGLGNTMNWVNAKPTYNANGFGFNNRPAIVLGSSSALQAASFPMGTGNTLTAWFVGTAGTTASQSNARVLNYLAPGLADFNNATSWGIYRGSATAISIIRNSTSATTATTRADPVPHRFIYTISSSGVITPYVDGVAGTTATSSGAWASAGTAQIGRQDGTTGSYWAGPIGECGIARGYSDATTVGLLDAYLQNKWSTQMPSPPGVSGIIGWWDASVAASLSLSGSNITGIADQSGNFHNMSVASGTTTYNATGFNSRPAIVFASGSGLRSLNFQMGTGNTLTIWYVGTLGTGAINSRILAYPAPGHLDFNAADSWVIGRSGGANTISQFTRNSVAITSTATADPAPHRVIVTISTSGAMTHYIDGVAGGTGTSAGNWANGGVFGFGAGAVGDYWIGPTAEAGVATGYSDATAVAQLDTYLKNKWGL